MVYKFKEYKHLVSLEVDKSSWKNHFHLIRLLATVWRRRRSREMSEKDDDSVYIV